MPSEATYKSMRAAYADAVIDLAKEDPALIFVSSDCGSHEREFLKVEGSGRLVETGIAEANAAAIAAGLASEGFKPHILNFSYLLGRMYNQISQSICQDSYNVKITGYYAGVWGTGGRSHNCVTDLAIMRALPNLSIFAPADYWETKTVIRQVHSLGGPAYVRISGVPTPVVFDSEPEYSPLRRMTNGDRCTIFCHGTMVYEALLANRVGNLGATVVNVPQVKPLPVNQVVAEAQKTGHVIVVEEHSLIGGLGEAICSLLTQNCPMPVRVVAVPDMFPWSVLTETPAVYQRYGISSEDIIAAAHGLLGSV